MQVRVVEDETCAPELEPARLAAIANRTDWDNMDWFMTGWTKQQVAPSQNTALAYGLRLARSSLPHSGYLVLPTATVKKTSYGQLEHGLETGLRLGFTCCQFPKQHVWFATFNGACVPLPHTKFRSEA